MSYALLVLPVAFAALCVWVTVRIVNRREWWAIRTAMLLVLLCLWYVVSMAGATVGTSWEHHPFAGPFILLKLSLRECHSLGDFIFAMTVCVFTLAPSVHWAWTGKAWSAVLAAVVVGLSIGLSILAAMRASC